MLAAFEPSLVLICEYPGSALVNEAQKYQIITSSRIYLGIAMATFSIYHVDKSSMVPRDACASLRQLMKNKQRAQGMNLLSQAQELCNNVCQQNLPLENSIAPLSAYKESSIQVLLLPPLHLPTPLYSSQSRLSIFIYTMFQH